MARHVGPRTVQCYHCRHRFEVGGRAQSTSCPHCNKPVIVENVVVDRLRAGLIDLRTCGSLTIKKRGRLMVSKTVEAHGGIVVEGVMDAGNVVTGGPVVIHKKAQWKGNLQGPSLVVEAGARISPSLIEVPADPLGLADLGEEP